MSNEAPSAPPAAVPPVEYETKEFSEGAFKGFKFVVPQYNNLDAAIEIYSADVILSLFNTQIASRIRTKVTNDLPETKNLKPNELSSLTASRLTATGGTGVLFTETQAKEWRPDVRDLTPKQLFKKASELFKEGKVAEGQAMLLKMQEMMAREAANIVAEASATAS